MNKSKLVEETQTYEFDDNKRIRVEYKDGVLDEIVLINNDSLRPDFFYFTSELDVEETIENLQAVLKDINNG